MKVWFILISCIWVSWGSEIDFDNSLTSGLEVLKNSSNTQIGFVRKKRFIDYLIEGYADAITGCGFYPSKCEYQRKANINIKIIKWVEHVCKYLENKSKEIHQTVKTLEKQTFETKMGFKTIFDLNTQVVGMDPLAIRERQDSKLDLAFRQMTSPSTAQKVFGVLDHVFNIIAMALLPLYATPLGLFLLVVGSGVGLGFRIYGAKAERDQWKNFYEKTEAEKRRIMTYLANAENTIQKMEDSWVELRKAIVELGTRLEDHHNSLKLLMPHIFHFNTDKFKKRLKIHHEHVQKMVLEAVDHNHNFFRGHCILTFRECNKIEKSTNSLMELQWETSLGQDAFQYITTTIDHEKEHISEVFKSFMQDKSASNGDQVKLARRVGASIANFDSLAMIISNARDVGITVNDGQVLDLVERLLFSERCYISFPLGIKKNRELINYFSKFDTPNLRMVTPALFQRIKAFNLKDISIDMHTLSVLIKNSDGIQFTEDELYTIIAYMEPDLEAFGGQSLLPYRYCIDKDHRCHGVVNHVSKYSLIHSIDTEEGRCIVNSVNLRKVKKSDNKGGSFCLSSDEDGEDDGSRNKCSEYVKVMGTNDIYDGIYKKSSLSEHGYPVYDGPGDVALSWAKNHWWITPMSEIGENNGYAYLDVPMDCPGDTSSILRRGGSDRELPGEKIEAMNLDYGLYRDCSEEIKISGFLNSLDGIYHKQSRKEATSGHPLYKQIKNTNYVIAWSGDLSHWILTDKAHAGTSAGFAWFRQDEDEHCPGIGDVTVSDHHTNLPDVKVKSLDRHEHPLICVNKSDDSSIRIVNGTKVSDVMAMYQMELCQLIPSDGKMKIFGDNGDEALMHGLNSGCKYNNS